MIKLIFYPSISFIHLHFSKGTDYDNRAGIDLIILARIIESKWFGLHLSCFHLHISVHPSQIFILYVHFLTIGQILKFILHKNSSFMFIVLTIGQRLTWSFPRTYSKRFGLHLLYFYPSIPFIHLHFSMRRIGKVLNWSFRPVLMTQIGSGCIWRVFIYIFQFILCKYLSFVFIFWQSAGD